MPKNVIKLRKKLANKPKNTPKVLNIKGTFKSPEPIIAFVTNRPVAKIEVLFSGFLFSPSSSPGSSLNFLKSSFSAFSGSVSLDGSSIWIKLSVCFLYNVSILSLFFYLVTNFSTRC